MTAAGGHVRSPAVAMRGITKAKGQILAGKITIPVTHKAGEVQKLIK